MIKVKIAATPIPEIEGGTDVKHVRLDIDHLGLNLMARAFQSGPEAHALALQMLQAASTLLRADNTGFDLSDELEITIAQLEMLIEEQE